MIRSGRIKPKKRTMTPAKLLAEISALRNEGRYREAMELAGKVYAHLKPPKKKSDPALNRLKKLCRYYVVVLRDKNTCQRCGNVPPAQIHWAHVMTRNAKSLVCVPWNSLALCAGCHFWFDGNKGSRLNPSDGLLWWRANFPDRAMTLFYRSSQQRNPKRDVAMDIRWFEREIVLAGGSISDAVKPRKKSEGA